MSEEFTTPDLVERTRNLYDAANSGNFDAMTSFFAVDAVWVTEEGVGTFEGVAAIRSFVEDWQGSYEQYEAEMEELLGLGNGVTFAVSIQKGRLLGSSRDAQIRFAAVYTWADGMIVKMTSYNEIDKARAAAERLAEERGEVVCLESSEIVKRGIAAYNAGDMDAMMNTYSTDVEALPDSSAFPDAHPCHGRAEFRAWLEESATAWTKPSWVVTEIVQLDSERVLVRGNWGGEGVASGLSTVANISGIFVIPDGQISRVEFFVDHLEALKAAGLAE